MPRLTAILCCIFAWLCASLAAAQPVPAPPRAKVLTEDSRISLMTMYPGDEIHAAYGHTAIRVTDPNLPLDAVFNYGTFDFHDGWFILKFMRGQLDYALSVQSFPDVMDVYKASDRSVVEQVLDIPLPARNAMFAFLVNNSLPENRTYRYDFIVDNCSTRPRDVIERVLPTLRYDETKPAGQGETFRDLLLAHLGNDKFIGLGTHLLMAMPVDRVPTYRQRAFLPLELFAQFEHATIVEGGTRRPLVSETRRLFWSPTMDPPRSVTPWPAITFWILFGITALGTLDATIRRRPISIGTRIIDSVIFTIVGLAGVLILVMATLTEHNVTHPNWNLLWAWPTHLFVAASLLFSPRSVLLRYYLMITALAGLVVVIGWSAWPQELPPPMVPVVLIVVMRAAWNAWRMDVAREAGAQVSGPTA